MNKDEITKKLNSVLRPVDCDICPLQDVCSVYEDLGNDSICNILFNEISVEK